MVDEKDKNNLKYHGVKASLKLAFKIRLSDLVEITIVYL